MKKKIKTLLKKEKGIVSVFLMFVLVGLMALMGLMINVMLTTATISHAKSALKEAVEFRAEAIDIPLKEEVGIIEVMNFPHTGTNTGYVRPTRDSLGKVIPPTTSSSYEQVVNESIILSKVRFLDSMKNFVGTNIYGTDMLPIEMDNICFDVRPLPQYDGEITFSCPLKDYEGNIKTVEYTVFVRGYEDIVNSFDDEHAGEELYISNAVFGAAIIKPNSIVVRGIAALGARSLGEQVIYSVAYPQIDTCYGEFCH